MLNQLADFAPRLVIARLISPAALGTYTVGRETSSLATNELIAPLRKTLFPSFSALKHDPPRLRRAILNATKILISVALPIGFGIALCAEEIVLILLGPKWIEAVFVLQVIAPMQAILVAATSASSLMMALGEVRSLCMRAAFICLVTWPAVYVGVLYAGIEGAVLALAISMLPNLMTNLYALKRFAGIGVIETLLAGWRAYASIAVMSAALLLLPNQSDATRSPVEAMFDILPYVACGGILYVATHYFLWRVSGRPNDIETYVQHFSSQIWNKARARLPRN